MNDNNNEPLTKGCEHPLTWVPRGRPAKQLMTKVRQILAVLKPPNGMGKWNGLRESICMGWLEDPEWVAKWMVARNAESRNAEPRKQS